MNARWMDRIAVLAALLIILTLMAPGYGVGWSESNARSGEVYADSRIIDEALVAPFTTGILSVDGDGITLYWKRPENIEGYQVWRKHGKDGKYTLLAEIPGVTDPKKEMGATSFYADRDFDRNAQSVYYRVTSYRDADGVRYSSAFSHAAVAERRKKLTLNVKSIAMPSGTERTLTPVKGWDIVEDADWSTADPSVATVEDGVVRAVARGKTTITCKKDGESAKLTVKVDREEQKPLGSGKIRYSQGEDGIWRQLEPGDAGRATIMMAGDLLCMGGQQRSMFDKKDGYNFNSSYTYVPYVLGHSDLAIGNLETVLSSSQSYARQESRIDGMPNCNAPARYLDAVRYGGFDGLVMANNHCCDAGLLGISETLKQVEEYGFGHTGLFEDASDLRGMIFEVNGIKVGYVAYVGAPCHYNGKDKSWDTEIIETKLNYYDREKVERDIQQLRSRGADFVFVYMHWGITNHFTVKQVQWDQARELAEIGADYIVGAHPHVLQSYAEIVSSTGKVVPCMFSLGNFNGCINQTTGNLDTVLLVVTLARDGNGKVSIEDSRYIPFYNFGRFKKLKYATVPIADAMNGGLAIENEAEVRARITAALGDGIRELDRFDD